MKRCSVGAATRALLPGNTNSWLFDEQEVSAHFCGKSATPAKTLLAAKKTTADAVQIIFCIGSRCNLAQTALCVAATFFHRFFMRETFERWDVVVIEAAFLLFNCFIFGDAGHWYRLFVHCHKN